MTFEPRVSLLEAVRSNPMLSINAQERGFALEAARSALITFLACGGCPSFGLIFQVCYNSVQASSLCVGATRANCEAAAAKVAHCAP